MVRIRPEKAYLLQTFFLDLLLQQGMTSTELIRHHNREHTSREVVGSPELFYPPMEDILLCASQATKKIFPKKSERTGDSFKPSRVHFNQNLAPLVFLNHDPEGERSHRQKA